LSDVIRIGDKSSYLLSGNIIPHADIVSDECENVAAKHRKVIIELPILVV
jgi:hypothetical protein